MPTRKALALLIYLAVEGGRQPRAKLATLFFPESREQRSRSALRSTLAYLRRGLNARGNPAESDLSRQIVDVEGESLAIHKEARLRLDIQTIAASLRSDDLQELQAALALVRGPFLETFSLPDAPEFDTWVSLQAAHWHRQVNALYHRHVHSQSHARQFAAALPITVDWLAHDPLYEPAHRELMQLHALNGDRRAALAAYQTCVELLHDELGAEPEPATQRLAERIQAGALVSSTSQPLGASLPPPGVAAVVMPFAGRSVEFRHLTEVYATVRRGQTQVVLLEGEMGIGKTRLAQEFSQWLQLQGADLLSGRAFEAGGRLPYQPLVDALRVRLEQENAPDDLLGDVWLAELSRLLPELRERYPDLPSPLRDENLSRTRLPAAIARLGEALAHRAPLVWFVDDLQWMDTASRDLLHYVVHTWSESSPPVLLLLTLRSEAMHAPSPVATELQQWLDSLQRIVSLQRIHLKALSSSETAALALSLVGEKAGNVLGPWLGQETGGHPLFITETLKVLRDRGILVARAAGHAIPWTLTATPTNPGTAPGLRQMILTRLRTLTPAATALLAAAAVIGRPCTFERLCQITGLDELAALPALELLLQRELLQENNSPQPYTFIHDRIRDVVYTESGDARRRLYHRRAFATLEADAASPAELAHHALAAHLAEPAFRHSLAAGQAAMEVFALRDAAAYLEQALQLLTDHSASTIEIDYKERGGLYAHLSRVYEHLGEYARADSVANTWLELARTYGDRALECDALDRLAAVATYTHQLERSTTLLQKALGVAHQIGDQRRLAAIEWSLAQAAHHRNEMPTSQAFAASALARARELADADLIAGTLNSLAYACLYLSETDKCIDYMEEAQTGFRALGNRALEADCSVGLAAAHNWNGQAEKALEIAQGGYAIAVEIDSLWGQVINGVQVTLALVELGHYGPALETAQRDVQLARPHKGALQLIASMAAGAVYRALGDLAATRSAHLEARSVAEASGVPNYLAMAATDLCTDAALAGDWAAAYTYAQEAVAHRDYTMSPLRYHPQWTVTAALVRGGNQASAQLDLQRAQTIVSQIPRFRLDRLRAQAFLAAWHGHAEQASTHLESALQMARAFSLPAEEWQILMQLRQLTNDVAQIQRWTQQIDAILHTLAQTIDDKERRQQFVDVLYGQWPAMLRLQ